MKEFIVNCCSMKFESSYRIVLYSLYKHSSLDSFHCDSFVIVGYSCIGVSLLCLMSAMFAQMTNESGFTIIIEIFEIKHVLGLMSIVEI